MFTRLLLRSLLLLSLLTGPPISRVVGQNTVMTVDTLTLFDATRQRSIPLILYTPTTIKHKRSRLKPALLNHGYGGHHTDYSFIAATLVAQGYVVASIQHELPGDEPLPTTGNPRLVRRPNWERGVRSMQVARTYLNQHVGPSLDREKLLLVGHSNGGDMAMLFAQLYPKQVDCVISLDNRRMPLPRTRHPRVLSIRSSDQVADEGVLPTSAEQKRFGITIVPLPAMLHNDMWDGASNAQKQAIQTLINSFLITH